MLQYAHLIREKDAVGAMVNYLVGLSGVGSLYDAGSALNNCTIVSFVAFALIVFINAPVQRALALWRA